jgi:hypothetical protein
MCLTWSRGRKKVHGRLTLSWRPRKMLAFLGRAWQINARIIIGGVSYGRILRVRYLFELLYFFIIFSRVLWRGRYKKKMLGENLLIVWKLTRLQAMFMRDYQQSLRLDEGMRPWNWCCQFVGGVKRQSERVKESKAARYQLVNHLRCFDLHHDVSNPIHR